MRNFKNPRRWIQVSRRPFHVEFVGEGAADCGGPMRDAISNLCLEITNPTLLPLLIPTANNLARTEPYQDCFQFNPNSKEPYMLDKFTFLGYFLGWSLINMGALAIDFPMCIWRRIVKRNYIYTIEDLRELDVFRAEMLK